MLLQADDARADFAAIGEDLDFIKAQLARMPTRKDTTSSRRRTDALSLLRCRETHLNPAGAVHGGLAPILFSGTADADLANDRTRHARGKELRPDSTLIWDNAAFHKKQDLDVIARESGHHTLILPPYSPDLSRIEPDFVNLKKIRQYAPPDTSLSDIVRSYGNYSE